MERKIWRIEYNWRSLGEFSKDNGFNDDIVNSYEVGKGQVSEINQIQSGISIIYTVEFYNHTSVIITNPNKVFCYEVQDEDYYDGFGYYKALEGVH